MGISVLLQNIHMEKGGLHLLTHGEPWGIADGNTGAPTYDHGRPPAPQAIVPQRKSYYLYGFFFILVT